MFYQFFWIFKKKKKKRPVYYFMADLQSLCAVYVLKLMAV